jgi:serine O-acetyltransferase
LNHNNFVSALAFHISTRLGSVEISALILNWVFEQAMAADSMIVEYACRDLEASFERDPACDQFSMPFLFFKGYHALQAYRVANYLWRQQRCELALFLQNRMSVVFDVDIHPAATLGYGIMIDHATGVVIGETAVVGNNVSMLHSVTLGGCGSGKGKGRRHPQVGDGVLISAGAKIIGSVLIGDGAKIAAGSLVLVDVAAHTTVAGVPARVVGKPADEQPALNMDQQLK